MMIAINYAFYVVFFVKKENKFYFRLSWVNDDECINIANNHNSSDRFRKRENNVEQQQRTRRTTTRRRDGVGGVSKSLKLIRKKLEISIKRLMFLKLTYIN